MNEQPLDSDVVALLGVPDPSEQVGAEDLTIDQLRQNMRDAITLFTTGVDPVEVDEVTDELVPVRDAKIPVRIYGSSNPTAVIVYFHGGAWMVGDIETHDLVTRRLCRDTKAMVVSVDYRMLPEHPFPTPFDDAYDATLWASGLRPDLPLLVAGDSAGGTLAACVALRARDEVGPRIDAQVLIYPGIDDDLETPSMRALEAESHITRDDLRFYFAEYASTAAALASPYALPGRAESLAGLPPALVAIAGHDLLRSSEEDYARRLEEAGVPVAVQRDLALTHGWIDYAPRVPEASRAFDRLSSTISDLIARVTEE
jgi:acetyl esterase